MAPITSVLVATSILAAYASAQAAQYSALVGTWSTKSGKVITGPGFYDPSTDSFTEPALTGISYSFTSDGHYEEAYFRAIPNPVDPTCPQATIQWQHGAYMQSPAGYMMLVPIAQDGRSLMSDPCSTSKQAILSRYSQNETFSKFEVAIDPYNNVMRLDLYGYDGTPMNPMWQKSTTPQMLPTTTLAVPTGSSTAKAIPTTTSSSKARRAFTYAVDSSSMDMITEPLIKTGYTNAVSWFWIGLGLTSVGGTMIILC